jgi:hypothetical protein
MMAPLFGGLGHPIRTCRGEMKAALAVLALVAAGVMAAPPVNPVK